MNKMQTCDLIDDFLFLNLTINNLIEFKITDANYIILIWGSTYFIFIIEILNM